MAKNIDINENVTSDESADILIAEGTEKFAYLAEKDPTPKQEFYAAAITALTGVEVTAKQYQAMICAHRYIQASDLNRARADYRPRSAQSVIKASETLLENASSLIVDNDGALISKSATHIPEDLFAPGELARMAAEAQAIADAAQEAPEAEPEVEEAPEADWSKLTKAELIEDIMQHEIEQQDMTDEEMETWADQREGELRRHNKAKLIEMVKAAQSANA